jgi:thiosulfate/3-mercaptopyruvate sulfurtransferase
MKLGLVFYIPLLAALGFGGALAGCALKPTVAHENPDRKAEGIKADASQTQEQVLIEEPIVINERTVIIDARPAFEYSMAHIPRAINLKWSDFTEPQPVSRGVLQRDTFAIARRLARLGLTPDSQVVVVGEGTAGQGEEGRLAWMLAYLGVKNVRFAALHSLKIHLTNIASENITSVPIWKPEPIESLNVTKAELLEMINKTAQTKPLAFSAGTVPLLYRMIDVRSEREYLGKEGLGLIKKVPDMGAVNIPWTEFFTDRLSINPTMRARLESVGIKPEHRIIVLGNDGVSSAAVTMALRTMGFSQAGNYAGGLRELLQAGAE